MEKQTTQETRVKYLIIRFSSIGDIVLTTPVVRALKTQVNGAQVHFLTKEQYAPVLAENPYIDKLHLLGESLSQTLKELKAESFDYVIDLHKNIRSFHVKHRLRRMHFSFDKLNWQKWLMVNFKKNKLPEVHIVERYMQSINLFDTKNDKRGLDYFVPITDEVNLLSLPGDFPFGYIAFAIGAKHATKRLPTEKIISICRKIEYNIILLGGKHDAKRGAEIEAAVGEKIYNACGKYTINQSASLLRQSKLVITHDTGLMHIAAAFKKKIISIWGNTIPEFGMFPYMPDNKSVIAQVKHLKCRPCSKIGFDKCPKKHFQCMQAIDEEKIAQLALWLILEPFGKVETEV